MTNEEYDFVFIYSQETQNQLLKKITIDSLIQHSNKTPKHSKPWWASLRTGNI